MKKLKRIVGVILAAMTLAMCLSISAFAAETPKGKITIQNKKSETHVSIRDKAYKAYKVFDLVQDDAHETYAYTLNAAFTGLFSDSGFAAVFPDAEVDETKTSTIYNFVSNLDTAKDIETFANYVYSFATKTGSTISPITKTAAATADSDIETAVFDDLELGYYLIYGEGSPLDNSTKTVVTACALDTTTWTPNKNDPTTGAYEITIDVKVGVPTVEKKIVQNKGTATENLVDADSANIGDKVDFRVTSEVPDLTGYTEYTFKMTDTMSEGLTYNNDMEVKIGTDKIENPATGDTLYTVVSDTNADTGITTITVTFTDFYNLITEKPYAQGTAITFDYSANLNKDAVISPDANPNTAKITYSNDPHTDTTNDSADDTVNVYTFELDIFKFAKDTEPKKPLEGAEFEVRKNGATDPIKFVKDGTAYRVADVTETTGTVTKVVSDANGNISIIGLGAGDYALKETTAPKGYDLLEADINVKIEPEFVNGALDKLTAPATGASYALLADNAGIRTEIENTTGTLLPSTGGMGTVLIYVVGGLLIAIAVISVTARQVARKKQ